MYVAAGWYHERVGTQFQLSLDALDDEQNITRNM
jgi:hypothetical protein